MTRTVVLGVLLLTAWGSQALEADGRLVWGRWVTLSTPVSGMVADVPVRVGDRVAAGDTLVRLEDGHMAARLAAAEKATEHHRQALAEAGRELERTRELYDRTLLADHDVQVAEIAYAAAAAEHGAAVARLEAARLAHRHSVVRAPFAGVVAERLVHPGMAVVNTHAAVPLVTLAAARPYTAVARVTADWAAVKRGTAVTVRVGDAGYPGTVAALIAGAPGAADAGYRLEVVFEGPAEEALDPGLPARIVMR